MTSHCQNIYLFSSCREIKSLVKKDELDKTSSDSWMLPREGITLFGPFLDKQSMIFRELSLNEHTISFTIQNFKHRAIWVGNFKRV